jgi:hypothetical protein
MPSKRELFTQREGIWDELISNPTVFAGKRVRVTVLPDRPQAGSIQNVYQWLAEGERLEITPLKYQSDPFTELFVENVRKQDF